MSANKPSVFISSTIHDFRDLRSALRHYLASLGFDVFMSEFNDFPKALDANAFHAALDAIKLADFYILLIGSRVGTLFDAANGISVTRQEYRTAYDLATRGAIRPALFVRREIWELRRDRNALELYLENEFAKSKELSPSDIEKIAYHPGPLSNQPALLFDFLDEISRVEQTQAASLQIGEFPAANWVHSFDNFEDIVDALRVQLHLATPLSTIALRANIRREIIENIQIISTKYEDVIGPTYTWAKGARKHLSGDMHGQSRMPGRYFTWALVYALMVFRSSNMSSRFIDQASESGEFLEYDRENGEYISGMFNERILQLGDRIRRFRSTVELVRQPLTQLLAKYSNRPKTEAEILVSNEDLVWPLALADIEEDIVHLSIAVVRALDGDTRWLSTISLNPSTPFVEEAERVEKEAASIEDVEKWIKSQVGEEIE